ncbi:MAG: hypothetical protein J6V50_02005 [Clostridia bacterium]|nr:hypothetical protein [Clostridia bacterium]
MLGKLLKYDLRYVYRPLFVFYSLAIFFGLLTRVFLSIEDSFIMYIIGKICSGVTISMMFNIVINNVMGMWARFRRNLYGDESYLVHTLPTKRSTVYIAKSLAGLVTLFTSFGVIILSLFVAYYSKDNMEIFKAVLATMASGIGSSVSEFLTFAIAVFFVEILNALGCGFTGIVLGHKMNSGKIGFSVLFGFMAYLITQALGLGAFFFFALFNPEIMNLFTSSTLISIEAVKELLILAIPVYFALCVLSFVLNLALLKKGVNVE